jgi:hypothetical protein
MEKWLCKSHRDGYYIHECSKDYCTDENRIKLLETYKVEIDE